MVTRKSSPSMTNKYYGLSADTKPVGAPNGSTFYEIDTGSVYMYDAANKIWIKQSSSAASSGGGGGFDGDGYLIATDSEVDQTLDNIFGD